MELTNFRWVKGEDRPELAVDIDGVETIIPAEQKPTLIENGYLFLGAAFETELPELSFEGIPLRGFVLNFDLTAQYVALTQPFPA